MAKKNKYAGKSQQEIQIIKNEKKVTMIAALFFILMIVAGLMLSMTDACGWDDSEPAVSPTSQSDE